MEEKMKKNKRIRYPKKQEQKEQKEQKTHFTLDVQDSNATSVNNFGK